MRSEYQIYLSLVRAALWGEPVTWPEEQEELFLVLNTHQGTGPLVFPYILTQNTVSPAVRAHMKSVCMATMQNQVPLHLTLAKAWSALQKAGIRAVLMKGAGLAALYPEPYYRAWGDIDLFVGKEQYHAACATMRETFPSALKFDEELEHYKHYNLIADGVSIEMHRVSIALQHPLDERRYARMESEGMAHTESLVLNELEVQVPEPTYNALFVFFHSWEHMISAGANLRQLCDLALLLHRYAKKINPEVLKRNLRSLHLLEPWQLYMYILVHYMGLPEEEAAGYTPRAAAHADRLMEDLLSGRMRAPKQDEKTPAGRILRKWYTMKGRNADARRIARYSPAYARHMIVTTWLHGAARFFAPDRHWE